MDGCRPSCGVITGNQIRAARHLAGIDQVDLAKGSGLSVNTIRNLEAKGFGVASLRKSTIDKVREYFKSIDVFFTCDTRGYVGVCVSRRATDTPRTDTTACNRL
ncbi:helix-turn-helix DNA binding domain protein [Rhodobacter phage RcMenchie]|nr:helix-turn-helix DNA binding domain protein [Rhodobacter phage RcTiptonus]UUV44468.1 helix-turn-helix DNA binding domain protein [Rhodobacter phage RcMenchie]